MRSVIDQFENYAKLNKRLPPETGIQLGEIEDASTLADAIASNLSIKVADKQALLGELNPARRLEMVFAFMEGELGVLQVEKKIRSRVKRQMEKTQREYYLNEQLKAIQRELGNEGEEGGDELQELAEKIRRAMAMGMNPDRIASQIAAEATRPARAPRPEDAPADEVEDPFGRHNPSGLAPSSPAAFRSGLTFATRWAVPGGRVHAFGTQRLGHHGAVKGQEQSVRLGAVNFSDDGGGNSLEK